MKRKFFIILGTFLALILTFVPTSKGKVFAQNTNPESVMVIGIGEVCVNPTVAEIRFMLVCKENSIEETSNCMNEKLQNIINALSENDANISENITTEISSIRPIFELGSQMFEQRECYKLKTNSIENINEILNTLVSNGALFRGDIYYCIEDYQSEYSKALNNAKQNAIEKANLLGNNLKLEKICEDLFSYSCCYSSANNCITIEARVKAIFKSDSTTEQNNLESNDNENDIIIDDNEKDIA